MQRIKLLTVCLFIYFIQLNGAAADGKLITTSGLNQIEGSGGGGIVPWATLSGYDTRDEFSVNVFASQVNADDYRLHVWGANMGLFDRVEVSLARQNFALSTLGGEITQNVAGLKARLYGDVIYSDWPQISLGLQHKKLLDSDIAKAVGADRSGSGTDYYLAMTKVHLNAISGFNFLWNFTARATRANQLGLLGYGGVNNDDYEVMLEGSLGLLLNRNIAVGMEYRQKPDNLALKEEDWRDYFISYMPSKDISLTLAWTELGDIAGAKNQNGLYVSMTGNLW